jgi:hypothetical protein
MSAGIFLVPRRKVGGRFTGRYHVFCSLNADSARLFRHGLDHEASLLVERAGALEASDLFSDLVAAVAKSIPEEAKTTDDALSQGLSALAEEPALARLVDAADAAIAAAREEVLGQASPLARTVGEVCRIYPTLARLETSDGEAAVVEREYLQQVGLDYLNAKVVIYTETIAAGQTFRMIEQALGLTADDVPLDSLPRRDPFTPGQPLPDEPGSRAIRVYQPGGEDADTGSAATDLDRLLGSELVSTVVGPLPVLRWRHSH